MPSTLLATHPCPAAAPAHACAPPGAALARPAATPRATRASPPPPHRPGLAFSGREFRSTSPSSILRAQWLENTAEVDVSVSLDTCWDMWEDRTRIPAWMPWIKAVTIQEDDPKLSRWVLSTDQFGRTWEFSWLARNLTPVKGQKIHWTSVPGSSSFGSALDIANRGAIRFYKKGAALTGVKLTISYEVPDGLAPFASAVTPLVERILRTDMGRFKDLAEKNK